MEHNIRPTRAEVNDIANAVIDGASSLLLTNETAVGEHPVEVVKVLRDTVLATEASKYDDKND
jgi:pyruvate kinase